MGQPPGLIPARFPKIGRTGSFRFAERWKKRLGSRFYQESARAKNKNGKTSLWPSERTQAYDFEMNHRIVESNGIKMHLAEDGEGPLVVTCN